LLCLLLAAAGAYAGPQACRSCHPEQFRTQAQSHHAQALRRAASTPLAGQLADRPLRERSGIEFTYAAAADGIAVTITKGSRRLEAMLEWAFGAGVQAVTPVGRWHGRYFEHRISWYQAPQQAARTIGHPSEPSRDPERALGRMQDNATITRCFECHATAVRPGPDLAAMLPGVTCERCHGPGAEHAAHPSRENIGAHTRESAAQSVRFCAECHRAPAGPSHGAPEITDPISIRFQPVGLMASRCYRASRSLSCVTCHNPHQDLVRDAAFYAARCLSCHATGGRTPVHCRRSARENCLPCHMRRSSPLPFLAFTDHRIR
jgi:hypothetical protein